MPDEMKELGQSAVSVVAYLSNVFFWLKSDYFDGPSELKPLLHTWSLAVEEQFYILFPLILLTLHKLFKTISVYSFFFLLAISFTGCLVVQGIENSATFYLMPFRAWEFLFGSLCSLYLAQETTKDSAAGKTLPILGIILILGSIVVLDETYLFPGLSAIPVSIGTALVIAFSEKGTLIYRILASSPMVFLGKISYSTYLVHWPIVVFYNYSIMREPSFIEKITMTTASFVIGFLFYKYIENTFRAKRLSKKDIRQTFLATALFSIVVASVGTFTHFEDGFQDRFVLVSPIKHNTFHAFSENANCFLSTNESYKSWTGDLCLIGEYDKNEAITLLWGDSHANHLVQGILSFTDQIPNNVLLYANSGCAPIFDEAPHDRPNCPENNAYVLDIIKRYHVQKVVLAASWRYARHQGTELASLVNTIELLTSNNIDVAIINQLPVYSLHKPQYLSLRLSGKSNFDGTWTMKPTGGVLESSIINKLSVPESVKVFDPFEVFCLKGECTIMDNYQLMVVDAGHLSIDGSIKLIEDIITKRRDFF